MQKMIYILLVAISIIAISNAYDTRWSNGVPYLAPDPSLKTTDPFYNPAINYQLPPVFGDNLINKDAGVSVETPAFDDPWMNVDTRKKTMYSETLFYHNVPNSYALTEEEMKKAGIGLGNESWL